MDKIYLDIIPRPNEPDEDHGRKLGVAKKAQKEPKSRPIKQISKNIFRIKKPIGAWTARPNSPRIPNFGLRKSFGLLLKIVVIFGLVGLLALAPYRLYFVLGDLYREVGSVKNNLVEAKDYISHRDFEAASEAVKTASLNFEEINKKVILLGQASVPTFPRELDSEILSNIKLVGVGDSLFQIANQFFSSILPFINGTKKINNSQDFQNLKTEVRGITNQLEKSYLELSKLDSQALPQDVDSFLIKNKEQIQGFGNTLESASAILDLAPEALGSRQPKNYLLLFQNNSELRATGGFIGTYGLLNLKNGKVGKLFIDSVYNPDGQLLEAATPPLPLTKITDNFGMRDANWWPDFPTSAKKIQNLYEKEGGVTTDGVIAMTPNVFEEILKIIGPIPMPDYDVGLTADNFVSLVQYKTEIDYDPAYHPKKMLADFAPIMLKKIEEAPTEQKILIFKKLVELIEQRHILVYSSDEQTEGLLSNLDVTGEIKNYQGDFLSVVNSNIGGAKSSRNVKELIDQEIDVLPDGSIEKDITVKRSHEGSYEWPDGTNFNYVRFYVPEGSLLINAAGFDNDEAINLSKDKNNLEIDPAITSKGLADIKTETENNKSVFGAWMVTRPGEERIATIRIRLPFRINEQENLWEYSCYLQKQAGVESEDVNISIKIPEDLKLLSYYPGLDIASGEIKYSNTIKKDQFISIILGK